MKTVEPSPLVPVECCYCGSKVATPEPPCLFSCPSCGHDFRVYWNRTAVNMELSADAKKFFALPKRT